MAAELLLVRHAPSRPAGHLYGRTDVSADTGDDGILTALRSKLGDVDACWSSPAKRCRETAAALFGNKFPVRLDDQLWEQDFGEWDGLPYAEVPDVGDLSPEDLAAHRPPGGESFDDLCVRVLPALKCIAGEREESKLAVVTHAGVVRAAIAMAIGSSAAALAFEVHTLSLTHIRVLHGDACSISFTNWTAACR